MRPAALLLLLLLPGWAQVTPQAIVEAFFSPSGIRNKRELYTGEMLSFLNERTLGQQFGKNATKKYRVLSSSETEAVFAVEVTGMDGVQDWYAFVQRDQGAWKLASMRSLALPNALPLSTDAQLRDHLRAHQGDFDALAATKDAALARKLLIAEVNSRPDGTLELILGRALRKAVGYLYVPEGIAPPPMTAFEVMYIEPVVGRWYVFKTN